MLQEGGLGLPSNGIDATESCTKGIGRPSAEDCIDRGGSSRSIGGGGLQLLSLTAWLSSNACSSGLPRYLKVL
jgi:hypothetical protein